MERELLSDRPAKGGSPERPGRVGLAVGLAVSAVVVAGAVRRLRRAESNGYEPAQDAEALGIEAAGIEAPGRDPRPTAGGGARPTPARRSSFDPRGRLWRWASVPVAVLAVGGALLLIQGRGGERAEPGGTAVPSPAPAAASGEARGAKAGRGADEARLVRGSRYSLAMPAGWRRANSQGGAAFAALAADGGADATLWIERAPELDFGGFESRSLDQLRALAGSARVVDRVAAPSPEATIVRLAADAPADEPRLEVTLRVAGPYRYYLATTLEPDASRRAIDGAELIHGSFTPEGGGGD